MEEGRWGGRGKGERGESKEEVDGKMRHGGQDKEQVRESIGGGEGFEGGGVGLWRTRKTGWGPELFHTPLTQLNPCQCLCTSYTSHMDTCRLCRRHRPPASCRQT